MKLIQRVMSAALFALSAMANLVLGCRADFGGQLGPTGFKAAVDLTNCQYHIMRMTGALTVNISSNNVSAAATEAPIGVLQTDPRTNEAASIANFGMSKVVGGGTVTAGAYVTTNASGRCVDAGSGQVVIGRALETLANDGEIGAVFLFPPVRMGSMV